MSATKKKTKRTSKKKKPVASSRRSVSKKGGAFQGYDYDNLPELTDEQLALFKRISPEQHQKFSAIDTVHILKNGEIVEVRKIGRPKKDPDEKENIVAIRLSNSFIKRLKKKAGKIGWQTYAKQILEAHLAE